MKYDAEILEAIREASAALQGSHPDVLAQVSAAIESARGGDIEIQKLEALFRSAAKALVTTESGAAQKLFKVAETLSEIANYWELPGDLP